MPALKNIRHERFCALYIVLGNASEAYRQAGYHARTPDVNAAQLLVRPRIASRLQELKAENARKSALTRDEALKILAEIARGPRDEFIKASDQSRAIEVASRMCGWNEADEVRFSATNSLTSYLLELRRETLGAPVLELMPEPASDAKDDENKSESP